MLKIANSMDALSFRKLMAVYGESNEKSAEENWPDLPAGFGLEMAEKDFYRYLREIFFTQPGVRYVVWEERGDYVSAVRLEPYRDGLLLEALETAPDHRRRGYARKLLQGVVDHTAGTVLYSHIDRRNSASQELHRGCGFEKCEDFAVYIDGSVNYRGQTFRRDG